LGEGLCLEAVRSGERVLLADLTARDALRNVDQHLGSVGLLNAGPAQLDEVDVELADVTAASIGGPHRYQQDTGLGGH